jgi:hypothetical protein
LLLSVTYFHAIGFLSSWSPTFREMQHGQALTATSGMHWYQRQVDFNVCVSLDFMMTELDALLTHCRLSTIASLHLVAHADKNTDWDDPCLFVGGANQHQFIFTTAVKRPE